MTGFDELDGHGDWEIVDGYGPVWFPSATQDWAPYRNGHWRWIAAWGWTWVDDMSWAFAPTHYGRWLRLANADPGLERWGWVPGNPGQLGPDQVVAGDSVAPAFMPAAVAFLGTAGVGLSSPEPVGTAVAWFPLAPGEPYWPGYTDDLEAIRRINAASMRDPDRLEAAVAGVLPAIVVNGDYQNRRFAAVVPRSVFTAGRPVASALVQLPTERLENAPVLGGSPQIAPTSVRPVAVASRAPAETRGIGQRLAGAVRTLAHMLRPRSAEPPRVTVVVNRTPASGGRLRIASGGPPRLATSGRTTVRIAATVKTQPSRLRIASVHRR